MASTRPPLTGQALQHEAEQFLYHEAWLVDSRRYDEWLALFTRDALYWVPNGSADSDPNERGQIVYEGISGLEHRVYRLKIPTIGPQSPPPSYRHLVGNVMPAWTGDNELSVISSQAVFFARQGREAQYAGTWEHLLTKMDGSWRIRRKKVSLINNDQSLWQLPLL